MKKQLLIASLFAGLVATTSFGQGYVTEGASKNTTYYGPTDTSGLGVGTGYSVFLWAPTSTADQLGAGLSTTATTSGTAWATIADRKSVV